MNGNTLRASPHHGWFDDFFSSPPSAQNVLKTHHPRDILFLCVYCLLVKQRIFLKTPKKNPLLTFCPNNNHYYYYMNNKPEKPDFSCQWPEEFLKAQAPKMSPSLPAISRVFAPDDNNRSNFRPPLRRRSRGTTNYLVLTWKISSSNENSHGFAWYQKFRQLTWFSIF